MRHYTIPYQASGGARLAERTHRALVDDLHSVVKCSEVKCSV